MNYKSKIAIILFSFSTLAACDSRSDTTTIHSDPGIMLDKSTTPDTGTAPDTGTENLTVNGDFESWTDAKPTGWTVIDSGIEVLKNSTIFKTGLNSAAISVNTATQGSTDFRQSVDVIAGKTYTFSTWIYHTEGAVRARLYVDDYQGYSNPDLVNQWQKLTSTYTATDNLSIELGVRFYDLSGFDGSESVYLDNFTFTDSSAPPTDPVTDPVDPTPTDIAAYYDSATSKTAFELKTALYNIIKDHTAKSYGDLWTFMSSNSLDKYYEKDNSILDMYSENPSSSDSYNYTPVTNQCGNYSGEGSCYNREHSFPKSWFNDNAPMYTDIHHLFATDGYVNGKRGNFPYGEVGAASFISTNGSKLGSARAGLGYAGDVFEPIDEFKGDFARAHFYMATRYQNIISTWHTTTSQSEAVLDGSSDKVFEPWVIAMLKTWSTNDPVSQKELDRNDAAFQYQGNRNPFIDHPEYINEIWVD